MTQLDDPAAEALRAIDRALVGDARVLDVGCGGGEMAERIHALPGVTLVATDFSPRLVALAAARGVDARQADVCYLPFEDASFDVVHAGWTLAQVRDLERALNEVRRVLRPGGTCVALAHGYDHLADLYRAAGGRPARSQFSGETGESVLRRRFDDVRRHDLEPPVAFPDHGAAQAHLDAAGGGLPLPAFEGGREYAAAVTVFEAR